MTKKDINPFHLEYAATALNSVKNESRIYDIVRRSFDIVFAFAGLLVGLPIITLFGLAVVLDTPGPMFYTQERVGHRGKLFTIYKLRSMVVDAEKSGPQWAQKNDSRITQVGKLIRKTRIDEIPQLFNILMGDMSFIGPRPERPMLTLKFNEQIPGFVKRLDVKPGLTGWAQVNGGYDLPPEEKLELDLYYIQNRCIQLDVLIILKTIKVVLTGDGAR